MTNSEDTRLKKKCALLGIEGIYFSSNSGSIAFESPFISKAFEDKYKFEYTVEQFVIGQNVFLPLLLKNLKISYVLIFINFQTYTF